MTELNEDLPGESDVRETELPAGKGPGRRQTAKFLIAGMLIGAAVMGIAGFLLWRFSKEQVIRNYIRKEAITEATDAEIEEGIYDGMAAALKDPYASYYNADETKANKERKSGTYEGIGVVISQDPESGAIVIVGVYPDTSAEEAGIEAGDIILRINDTDMEGLTTSDAVTLIGDSGRTVALVLEREGKPYEVTVERRKVTVPKVSSFLKEDNGHRIGYVRIESFIYTTADQFSEALDSLENDGMEGLIIDLRGNTGGLVDSAVDCLDRLLPKGLVVYTLAKDGTRRDRYSKGTDEIGVPIVLLVDAQTASAAEIFAGALRDRLGSPLVGTGTFGKGIMQITQFLADGSSFKYTSAEYYSPDGVNINGTGFEPDVEVELSQGEHIAASEDDNQFLKALEVVGGMMEENS